MSRVGRAADRSCDPPYDNSHSTVAIGNWDFSHGDIFDVGTSWLTGSPSGFTWTYDVNSPAMAYLNITSTGTIVADTDTLRSVSLQVNNLDTSIETTIYLKDTVTGAFLDLSGNSQWPPNEVTLVANRPDEIESFLVKMENTGGLGLSGEFSLQFGDFGIPGPGGLAVVVGGGAGRITATTAIPDPVAIDSLESTPLLTANSSPRRRWPLLVSPGQIIVLGVLHEARSPPEGIIRPIGVAAIQPACRSETCDAHHAHLG